MNTDELQKFINECKLDGNKICVEKNLHETLDFLLNNYSFDMLKSITCIDLSNGQFELIYNLYSTENEEDAVISIKITHEAESIADLFESAKADENEIYDMFGIKFIGNENLKRLYMPEDWDGYPLRKDYIQDDTRLAWNDNNSNNA